MILHCPCCQTRFSLEAAVQDSAARQLLAEVSARPLEVARPLVSYLGLFRSRSRALSWERALRLAGEVLALEADHGLLGAALSETVEAIWAKRERQPARPLTNHNYLRRVLESLGGRRPAPQAAPELPAPESPANGPLHPDVALRLGPMLARVTGPGPGNEWDGR